jgi:putative SOS response-associated peptidase YedK
MCGRFTVTTPGDLAAEFDVEVPFELAPRYNIAPTDPVVSIVVRDDRRAELMHWGLVPHWAKDRAIASKLINARSESLEDKPAFRDALVKRRCLVAADGFYEWKRDNKTRTPHYIRRPDGRPFGFAGLWERWKQPDDQWLITCTIVTADATGVVEPIHDRMPVIVGREDYERWLSPEPLPREALDDILSRPSDVDLECFEVSSLVNSVRNDGPELIAPGPIQQSLF